MRHLTQYLVEDSSACVKKLVDIVVDVATRLRSMGLPKGSSELVDAVRIVVSYADLRGLNVCDLLGKARDELYYVLVSVLAKKVEEEEVIRKVLKNVLEGYGEASILERIEKDLRSIGLDYGATVRKPPRIGTNEYEVYSRLKLLGIIRRKGRREKVVSKREAKIIANRIGRIHGSYENAVKDAVIRDIRRGGRYAVHMPNTLNTIDLSRLSVDTLLSFSNLLVKAGYVSTAIRMAKEAVHRISRGEIPKDTLKAFHVLQELNLTSDDVTMMLASQEPQLLRKLRSTPSSMKLIDLLRRLDDSSKRRLLKGLIKIHEFPKILGDVINDSIVDVLLFFPSLSSSGLPRDTYFLVKLGEAFRYLIDAMATGDQGYRDMALHLLSKLGSIVDYVDPRLARYYSLVSSLLEAYVKGLDLTPYLENIISRMSLSTATELLYRLNTSPDPRLRVIARRLLFIVASRLRWRYRFEGKRFWSRRGRLSFRRALRLKLFLSNDYNIAFMKRDRERVVLLLDKSGSMRPYSSIAALAASAFLANIEGIVFFDSNIYAFPRAGKLPLNKMLEILFGVDFEGYTDVSSAVLYAVQHFKPGKMIVISDLRQTVRSGTSVTDAFRLAVRRGWRVYVLAPPTVDKNAVEGLKSVKVMVFSSEEQLYNVLRRLMVS